MVDKIDCKIYLNEIEELQKNSKIKPCNHVSQFSDPEVFLNPCYGDPTERTVYQGGFLSDEGFLNPQSIVYHDESGLRFSKSGPRKYISFDPKKVIAGILTCGGICPGLNVVIRELYMTLRYNYQVDKIYGIKNGYQGIYTDTDKTYVPLENSLVKDIHKYGGTILGSSRGGFDLDKIVDSLIEKKINMLFIIGGDGTHKGIEKIADECIKRKLKIAICGIPKTIDNDIPVIDRTFGFETAVEQAVKVVEAANVEANSAINGIGIVKLFGRNCGFISLYAALASRDVNICLIPESEFELYGDNGLLDFVITRVKERGHCLIVVAEGCGSAIKDLDVGDSGIIDKSGNKKLVDVGVIIKDEISKYAKSIDFEVTIKYIDPTYIVRACPTGAFDTHYCARLANNAVHSAFAGWTNFSSGLINKNNVIIPIDYLNSQGLRTICPRTNPDYLSMLGCTGQREFINKKKV